MKDRKRIFEIIEKDDGDDLASHVYDIGMIVVIILSLLPLASKNDTVFFKVIDKCAVRKRFVNTENDNSLKKSLF